MDATAQVFVDAVATNRGVTPETVLADFGQGGVFVGRDAVSAGLADAVGTYESTFAALRDRGEAAVAEWCGSPKSARSAAGSGRAHATTDAALVAAPSTSELPMADDKTPPAAPATPPAIETPASGATPASTPAAPASAAVASIDEAAVRKAERERIASIRTLGKTADAALVEKCINDGVSADAAARVFLEAQQQGAAAMLDQLRGDERAAAPPPAGNGSGTPSVRDSARAATAAYYAQSAPRAATTTK
jgi:hypothetical protein